MRIAQVAPLYESVPPKCYGGTERIVSGVTEELVRRGHEVVLFASGDSTTAAELIACCSQGLRLPGLSGTDFAEEVCRPSDCHCPCGRHAPTDRRED
jgi:hypothetical protein